MNATLWETYKDKYGEGKDGERVVKAEAATHLDKILDAAKDQISTLTTLLTGGYFALISIGDIKDLKAIIDHLPYGLGWIANVVLVIPMILWASSFANANALYLSSITVDKGSDYEEAMQGKLEISLKLMLIGLAVLIFILFCYIAIPTPKQV